MHALDPCVVIEACRYEQSPDFRDGGRKRGGGGKEMGKGVENSQGIVERDLTENYQNIGRKEKDGLPWCND